MLRYSDEALAVRPRFYRFYNSIDIYVEDTDDETFYEKLLSKVLNGSIKVRRVFGLGGKVNLFKKVNIQLKKPSNRRVFFIADGDFDRILGLSTPNARNLHILREYCIENFLIEKVAIYEVMQEESSKMSLRELKALFNLSRWLEDCVNNLTPLFACFILIQKHKLGITNVESGIGPFISNIGIPQLDKAKVFGFIQGIKKDYPSLGGLPFDHVLKAIEKKMGQTWASRKRFICGKGYLLPLLRFEVKRHTRKDIEPRSFRFRIMKKCSLSSLADLKKQIETVACSSTN